MPSESTRCAVCSEPAVGLLLGPASETPRVALPMCARCGAHADRVMKRPADPEDQGDDDLNH